MISLIGMLPGRSACFIIMESKAVYQAVYGHCILGYYFMYQIFKAVTDRRCHSKNAQ